MLDCRVQHLADGKWAMVENGKRGRDLWLVVELREADYLLAVKERRGSGEPARPAVSLAKARRSGCRHS